MRQRYVAADFAFRLTAIGSLAGIVACAPDRSLSPHELPSTPLLAASPISVIAPSNGFRKAITVEAIRAHQKAFQDIAEANGGTRSSMDASHNASVEYVRARLLSAGFNVAVQPFTFDFAGDITTPSFSRVSPNPRVFTPVGDFASMTYSGDGDVTGVVRPVDLLIPSPGGSTSGCEASDFAGFPAGAIALVQRGTCTFRVKAENAAAAGAIGVIVMNEGNTPDREGVVSGDLTAPKASLPVIGITYALGLELGTTGTSPTVRMKVVTANGTASSSNLIAETPGGDPNNVIVVGAMMDSRHGPGINATSGSAAMLEIARVFAAQERTPTNRIRLIWFGAYAEGNRGTTHYVDALSAEERSRIRAIVDLHALGSPNFGRFVADADQSTLTIPDVPLDPAVDAASAEIEALFSSYFDASGLSFAPSNGIAAAKPFRLVGIPFGGLHAGTDAPKTAQEAALFGGTAGVPFDPCVFQMCDSFANTSMTSLDQMSDAAAHVILMLSRRNLTQKPRGGN